MLIFNSKSLYSSEHGQRSRKSTQGPYRNCTGLQATCTLAPTAKLGELKHLAIALDRHSHCMQNLCRCAPFWTEAPGASRRQSYTLFTAPERNERRAARSGTGRRAAQKAGRCQYLLLVEADDPQHKENGMRYQGILQESEVVMEKVS